MTIGQPYDGLVVVEAVSGPPGSALRLSAAMTGRILADLGARVIQVVEKSEQPEGQESSSGLENVALERFLSARKSLARGDIADREFVSQILRRADVAIVDRHVHRFIAAHESPRNIALLSLFSGKHADADIPTTEFTISALGGVLNMVGDPEREPLRLGGHQEAYALGLAAFCGLAALLTRRQRKQRVMTIQASLLDTIVWLNWKAVPLAADAPTPAGRAGAAAEWQVLRCADGWTALVYQEPDWPQLCDMVRDDRLRQQKFATRQARLENLVELAEIVESAFLSRTRRQIHDEALSRRLPLGPVWNPREVIEDPHNVGRALFEELSPSITEEKQPVLAPRLPVLWNGAALSSLAGHPPAAIAVSLS